MRAIITYNENEVVSIKAVEAIEQINGGTEFNRICADARQARRMLLTEGINVFKIDEFINEVNTLGNV